MKGNSDLVLVLAPTENDSAVAARVLQDAGVNATTCKNFERLCLQMQESCAVIVVAEESLPTDQLPMIQNILKAQEPWSDIPVILLTGEGPARSWESFSASGNISILERPFSRLTLVRAVEVGLRARRKQYQVRDLLDLERLANQKRDEFFATLSHELRTPLNVILGWTDILRTENLNSIEQSEALTVLERNARVQKALIDDLLDTSRIITGKLHFETLPVSLNKVVESAHKAFSPRAEEKNIRMLLKLCHNDCMVLADEQRLQQVISNLLTNAIKFTPDKGTITMSLRANQEGQHILTVTDTGQGIEKSFLPYVFDRLKQENMSTTRVHGGLGLGLAITAYIVEQHHGKVEVISGGRGKGAEFSVALPALEEKRDSLSPIPPMARKNLLSGVKVLVCDDSPDTLFLINLWLKKAKADVKITNSAIEALEQLPIFKPDILLSDIGMPEMDGYELISIVRSQKDPHTKNIPAIALTAYAKDAERTKALEAGFQMHITKPISKDQLVSAFTYLLNPA